MTTANDTRKNELREIRKISPEGHRAERELRELEKASPFVPDRQALRDLIAKHQHCYMPCACLDNTQRSDCASLADAILSAFTSPEYKSAPAYEAAHNSGEGDPSVMPDYVGADTAIRPQRALEAAAEHVCWFDWSSNDTDAVAAIEGLRKALAHTRPECGDAT